MMYLVGNGNQEKCSFDFSLLSFDEYKPFFNGLPNFIFKKCKHIKLCNDFYYEYKKDGRHSKRREQIIGASIMYNHPTYLQYLTKIIKRVVPKSLHLETLEFSNIKIPSKYINTICHAVANSTSVINIIFSDVPIGDRGFNELLNNVSPYQIQTITVRNGGLTAKVTDMVRDFLNKRPHNASIVRSIKEINIEQQGFPPEELEIIKQQIAAVQKDDDDWDSGNQWESRVIPQTEYFESSTIDPKRPTTHKNGSKHHLPDIDSDSDSSDDNLQNNDQPPKSSSSQSTSKHSRRSHSKSSEKKGSSPHRNSSIKETEKVSDSSDEEVHAIEKAPIIPIPVHSALQAQERDLVLSESLSSESSEEKPKSQASVKKDSPAPSPKPEPVKEEKHEYSDSEEKIVEEKKSDSKKSESKPSQLPSPKSLPKPTTKDSDYSASYSSKKSTDEHKQQPVQVVISNHNDYSEDNKYSEYTDTEDNKEEVHSIEKEGDEEVSVPSTEPTDNNKVVLEVDQEVLEKSYTRNENTEDDRTTFTTEIIEEYEDEYTFVTDEASADQEKQDEDGEKAEKSERSVSHKSVSHKSTSQKSERKSFSEKSEKSQKNDENENHEEKSESSSSSSSSKSSHSGSAKKPEAEEQSESSTFIAGDGNTCKPELVQLGVPETGA